MTTTRHLAALVATLLLGGSLAGDPPEPPAEGAPPGDPAESVTPETAPPETYRQEDPRYGLLSPLPDHGQVPPIVVRKLMRPATEGELARNAKIREYTREIRRIRHRQLGPIRVAERRVEGIAALRAFTDPDAFEPLVEELAGEADDVRLALLEHFAEQGDPGQGALAWMAIHDGDAAIRGEATKRVRTPAAPPVLAVLDAALRSPNHAIANHAGSLAGAINALETIPLLMFAQVTQSTPEGQGDIAWIAIQTQKAYTQRLQPIVGDGAAAFQPIPGVVSEGAILRVVDAVVVIYRTEIHRSLVAMTTRDWGHATAHLGYDPAKWWAWYNDEYVPYRNARAREAALANPP